MCVCILECMHLVCLHVYVDMCTYVHCACVCICVDVRCAKVPPDHHHVHDHNTEQLTTPRKPTACHSTTSFVSLTHQQDVLNQDTKTDDFYYTCTASLQGQKVKHEMSCSEVRNQWNLTISITGTSLRKWSNHKGSPHNKWLLTAALE